MNTSSNNTASPSPEQKSPTKKRSKVSRRELETLNDNNSKRARRDLPKCPICEHRIEPHYWTEHYQFELNRLAEPTSEVYSDPLNKNKGKRGAAVVARKSLEGRGRNKKTSAHQDTIERIQSNRSKRADRIKHIQQSSTRGTATFDTPTSTERDSEVALQMMQEEEAAAGGEVQTCFICNERLYGDLEAINLHIDNCLSNQDNNDNDIAEEEEDVQLTDEGDEDFIATDPNNISGATAANDHTGDSWEEYEWAGQRRVRATALMEGGYAGAGFATASRVEVPDEDDEDLDVEDDDAAQFGESQYTERDILVNENDEDANALREMVSGGTIRNSSAESSSGRRLDFEETVSDAGWEAHLKSEDALPSGSSRSSLLIDSLKARVRDLEKASKSINCLICLEPYKTPLTSIVCWHVHCEECWLRTLGSKKLCPQCQKITTPADLRRIYL